MYSPGSHPHGPSGPYTVYHLPIPGATTRLVVYYFPRSIILPSEIHVTIQDALRVMSTHYARYGDGPLNLGQDPYKTPHRTGVNCTIDIKSHRAPGPWPRRSPYPLSYRMVLHALHRLSDWLLVEAHYASVVAQVVDEGYTASDVSLGFITVIPYL